VTSFVSDMEFAKIHGEPLRRLITAHLGLAAQVPLAELRGLKVLPLVETAVRQLGEIESRVAEERGNIESRLALWEELGWQHSICRRMT
jgi:hypothetical protein